MKSGLVTAAQDLSFASLPGRLSANPFAGMAAAAEAGISMRVVTLQHDPQRTPHLHPCSAEVMFVSRGSGTLWVEGSRQAVRAGTCVLVPAGSAHATLPEPETEMELICFFAHPDLSANIVELDRAID